MKKIHIILFFTLWVIASSCSTYYVSNKQVMEVQQGMSRQNVERILGKPDYRRFDGNTEEWEFHRVSSVLYGNSIKIIVYFADGRVTSMDTFNGDEILLPPPVMMPPSVVVTNTPPVCPPQYEELKPARTQGEMAGARHVREWDPYTGYKQDWYETLDNNGNIRQVRPDPKITGGKKVHYMFDTDGNYTGNWVPNK